MFTVRAFSSRQAEPDNALLTIYERGLREHWPAYSRALSRLLHLAGLGGWSDSERKMLAPEIRRRGLSMADRRGIHRLLNPAAVPLRRGLLKNKRRFAERCEAAGIAVPETLYGDGVDIGGWLASHGDIIVKPSFSSKGRGVQRFTRGDDRRWTGSEEMDEAALHQNLSDVLSRQGIVQQCLATHPDIADLSPGALATLRVVTCRNETGAIEAASVSMRFSAGPDNPVDNFNAGNLVAAVDADGRCGKAYGMKSAMLMQYDAHPFTGSAIAGRQLPSFAEALELATRAHEALADDHIVVGWDIGLSAAGPLVIEGNWNPGTDIMQLTEQAGLDATRLGALYRHHLERLAPERWRQARPVHWDASP